MSKEDVQVEKIKTSFNSNCINCITKDILANLQIEDMFSSEINEISEEEIINIRTSLFPEIKIVKEKVDEKDQVICADLFSLDEKQESFVRKIPYGHYMITGVPGSGKTQILIARAIHLIKENPNWNIQIVTYNLSLTNKIESILNEIAMDYSNSPILKDVNMANISVSTFHKMAMRESGERLPSRLSSEEKNKWFNETLPQITIKKCKPLYDNRSSR